MKTSLLVLLLVACSHPKTAPPSPVLPAWLSGMWIREGVDAKDMSSWTPKYVYELMTPTHFGDVRIPIARPPIKGKSFAELTDAELVALADQRGFVGTTTLRGDIGTWTEEMNFQPPSGALDTARVVRIGPRIVDEIALDGSWNEHWWSVSDGGGRFLAIEVRRAVRLERFLVVAGDHFVYARNRAHDLPRADSLGKLFAATHPTRAQMIEMLDCEVSYGVIRGGNRPWQIVSSTLPWREGVTLEFPQELELRGDSLAPRAPRDEAWTIPNNTFDADELRLLWRPGASPR